MCYEFEKNIQRTQIYVATVSFNKTLNEYLFMGSPPSKIHSTFAASAMDLKSLANIPGSKVCPSVNCH